LVGSVEDDDRARPSGDHGEPDQPAHPARQERAQRAAPLLEVEGLQQLIGPAADRGRVASPDLAAEPDGLARTERVDRHLRLWEVGAQLTSHGGRRDQVVVLALHRGLDEAGAASHAAPATANLQDHDVPRCGRAVRHEQHP
jgi:non-ribosomal peptide synthetase component F